jgi:hypothetical protein
MVEVFEDQLASAADSTPIHRMLRVTFNLDSLIPFEVNE